MKKFLLFAWCVVAATLACSAASFTISLPDLLTNNGLEATRNITYNNLPKPMKYSGFEFTFDKGTAAAGPGWVYRNNAGNFSMQVGTTLKVSLPGGGNFSKVVLSSTEGYCGVFTTTTGSVNTDDLAYTNTWTGSASEITLTVTERTTRLTSISVEYDAELSVSALPEFTPAAGTYSDEVTVSISAKAGAKIYYTTDGEIPTTASTLYAAPFKITRTTTVAAIAVEEGKDASSVSTATYTVVAGTNVATIASYRQMTNGLAPVGIDRSTLYRFIGRCTVTYQNNNILLIQDNTGAIMVSGDTGHKYQPGDVITDFSGYFMRTDNGRGVAVVVPAAGGFGDPIEHTEFTVPEGKYTDILGSNIDKVYKLKDVFFSRQTNAETVDVNGTAVFFSGDKVRIYNGMGSSSYDPQVILPINTGWYDIYGFVSQYTEETTSEIRFIPYEFVESTLEMTDAPVMTPAGGTYYDPVKVTITAGEGEKIYYTTVADEDATPLSTLYTGPFTLDESTTVKAIAVAQGKQGSRVVSSVYAFDLLPATSTPVITPEGGEYVENVEVSIACETEGAVIYYTTDGTEPTEESTRYESPFTITESCTVKAAALAADYRLSHVAEAGFVITARETAEAPVFTPGAGEYDDQVTVTLTSATEGAEIRYTIDGTEPDAESPLYTAAFTLSEDTLVKAIAIAEGYLDSEVAEARYIIKKNGITTISADAMPADARYYDLQGRRVTTPSTGMYIMVAGGNVQRVAIK